MSYSTGHNDTVQQESDITIQLNDVDISSLTSSVLQLGNNINGYLLQIFKEAYDKGLRSGYVLGHEKGYKEGKSKGYIEGKKEGFYRGKQQGKMEIKEKYSQLVEEEEYVPQFNSVPNASMPEENSQYQGVNLGHSAYMAVDFQQ